MGTSFFSRPFLKIRYMKRKDVDDVCPVDSGDYRLFNRTAPRAFGP
jgi:hypothetical protein